MDHEWTDCLSQRRFGAYGAPDDTVPRLRLLRGEKQPPEHPAVSTPPGVLGDILTREILRLAQRVIDLGDQLFATEQERDAHKTAQTQAEHREGLWKASAEKVGAENRRLEGAIHALRAADRNLTAERDAARGERDTLAQRVKELEKAMGLEQMSLVAHQAAISHAKQRISDLEAVIRECGKGTPAPEEIDFEAFDALDPADRFAAYREAAGWALLTRDFEEINETQASTIHQQNERIAAMNIEQEALEVDLLTARQKIQEQRDLLCVRLERIRGLKRELAEKAEEIRSLNEKLGEAEELAADRLAFIGDFYPQAIVTGKENERLQGEAEGLRLALDTANDLSRSEIEMRRHAEGEARRLRTAIQAALEHLEEVRNLIVQCASIKEPPRQPLDSLVDAVDSAREALAGTGNPAVISVDPAKPGADHAVTWTAGAGYGLLSLAERVRFLEESLAPRVSDLEAAAGSPAWTKSDLDALLGRITKVEAQVFPPGKHPTQTRLHTLERDLKYWSDIVSGLVDMDARPRLLRLEKLADNFASAIAEHSKRLAARSGQGE